MVFQNLFLSLAWPCSYVILSVVKFTVEWSLMFFPEMHLQNSMNEYTGFLNRFSIAGFIKICSNKYPSILLPTWSAVLQDSIKYAVLCIAVSLVDFPGWARSTLISGAFSVVLGESTEFNAHNSFDDIFFVQIFVQQCWTDKFIDHFFNTDLCIVNFSQKCISFCSPINLCVRHFDKWNFLLIFFSFVSILSFSRDIHQCDRYSWFSCTRCTSASVSIVFDFIRQMVM